MTPSSYRSPGAPAVVDKRDLVDAASLRELVGRIDYQALDDVSRGVIDRLVSKEYVAHAWAAGTVPRDRRDVLLRDLLRAGINERQHQETGEQLQAALDYGRAAAKSVEKTAKLFKSAGLTDEEVTEALRVLRVKLYYHCRDCEEGLAERSRKKDALAAGAAAITWISESVRRLTAKPNIKAVASLATIVLGRDVSEAAVKKAAERNHRRISNSRGK
jgi:hypothetical protein